MHVTLNKEKLRQFYDRFGSKQDKQGFYEDAALDALIRHGEFQSAQSVFEIGCGTGKLAARLLSDHLPDSARYVGIDLSSTMADLCADDATSESATKRFHPQGSNKLFGGQLT